MPITTELTPQTEPIQRIVATRPRVDREQVKAIVADLSQRGRITSRDEKLFELLREFGALSLAS